MDGFGFILLAVLLMIAPSLVVWLLDRVSRKSMVAARALLALSVALLYWSTFNSEFMGPWALSLNPRAAHGVFAYMAAISGAMVVVLLLITARKDEDGKWSFAHIPVALWPVLLLIQADTAPWPKISMTWPLEAFVHMAWAVPIGVLVFRSFPRWTHVIVLYLLAAALAVTDEVLQIFVPDRVFDPRDIVMAVCASCYGVFLAKAREPLPPPTRNGV